MLRLSFPSSQDQKLTMVLRLILHAIFWLVLVILLATTMLLGAGIFIPQPVIAMLMLPGL